MEAEDRRESRAVVPILDELAAARLAVLLQGNDECAAAVRAGNLTASVGQGVSCARSAPACTARSAARRWCRSSSTSGRRSSSRRWRRPAALDKANEQLEFRRAQGLAAPGEGRGARVPREVHQGEARGEALLGAQRRRATAATDAAPIAPRRGGRNSAFRAPSVAPELKPPPQSGMVEYVGILKMRALNADGMRARRRGRSTCRREARRAELKTGAKLKAAEPQGRGRRRSGVGRGAPDVLGRPRRAPPRRQPRQVRGAPSARAASRSTTCRRSPPRSSRCLCSDAEGESRASRGSRSVRPQRAASPPSASPSTRSASRSRRRSPPASARSRRVGRGGGGERAQIARLPRPRRRGGGAALVGRRQARRRRFDRQPLEPEGGGLDARRRRGGGGRPRRRRHRPDERGGASVGGGNHGRRSPSTWSRRRWRRRRGARRLARRRSASLSPAAAARACRSGGRRRSSCSLRRRPPAPRRPSPPRARVDGAGWSGVAVGTPLGRRRRLFGCESRA